MRPFFYLLVFLSLITIVKDSKFELSEYYALNPRIQKSLIKNKLESISNDSLNRQQIYHATIKEKENRIPFNKKAKLFLIKSLDTNDVTNVVKTYINLGDYYLKICRVDSAYYYLLKAQKLSILIEDKNLLGQVYLQQAVIHSEVSNYSGSDLLAIKALKLFKKTNDELGQWDVLNLLAINSFGLNDFKNSIAYNQRALKLSKENELGLNEISLNNIGNNYCDLNMNKKAIEYFSIALKNRKLEKIHPSLYATLLYNVGRSKMALGKLDDVEALLINSLQIRNRLQLLSKIVYSKVIISEYYLKINDKKKSEKYAVEAAGLAKHTKIPSNILFSLKQLINVDPKNALKYSQEYIRISDSMQQLERETRNKFAKIAYETDEIIKEKESAEKKNLVISAIASGLILLLVLCIIIIMQRAKQKRLELEQVQQKANEEIYNLLLDKQNKIDSGRKIEKKRIAQDLHDSVLNRLASTRLNLHNIAENPNAEKLQKCLPFIDGLQDIEKEIRNIAHDLNRGAFSNAISFLEIVGSFIEDQQNLSSRKQHLEIDSSIDWELVSSNKKIHIFRILQEAFQNINKHSGAKSVMVSLLKRDEHILLEIFDDGDGFSFNEKKKGIGLQNIFSRAHSCGGSAQIKSRIHEGTTVIVKIPL